MYEWNEAVQKMIDWMEENLCEEPGLMKMSGQIGYSSQEALTRAFVKVYGCTPAVYRRHPVPVPIPCRKVVLFPEHYRQLNKGGFTVSKNDPAKLGFQWNEEACQDYQRHCPEGIGYEVLRPVTEIS